MRTSCWIQWVVNQNSEVFGQKHDIWISGSILASNYGYYTFLSCWSLALISSRHRVSLLAAFSVIWYVNGKCVLLHERPLISTWIKSLSDQLYITFHMAAWQLLGPIMHHEIDCDVFSGTLSELTKRRIDNMIWYMILHDMTRYDMTYYGTI